MRNVFLVFTLAVAIIVAGCDHMSLPSGPGPNPDPSPRPVPDEAYEGREQFDGTTVFVPIPYTSEFLEWQIIATKPVRGGTYTSDGQLLISARCVDRANLVKNIFVEVEAMTWWGNRQVIGSGLEFAMGQHATVCWRGWLNIRPPAGMYLHQYKEIPSIHFKIWINKSSAPALLPVDLEYDENTGWKRVN